MQNKTILYHFLQVIYQYNIKGGIAGIFAKTSIAPLERIKMLYVVFLIFN